MTAPPVSGPGPADHNLRGQRISSSPATMPSTAALTLVPCPASGPRRCGSIRPWTRWGLWWRRLSRGWRLRCGP